MNDYQSTLKLRNALDSGDVQELHESFSMGVDLNKWIPNWNAPALTVAIRHPTQCYALVKELLARGADPNQTDKMGYTPFFWGWMGHTRGQDTQANQSRLDAIFLLKNLGVWQNQIIDNQGTTQTLLHLATVSNFLDGIKFLIQFGFSTQSKNSLGESPLHLTLRSPEAAGVLLAFGADPDELDRNNKVIYQKVEAQGPLFAENWNARCEASRMRAILPEASSQGSELKHSGRRI